MFFLILFLLIPSFLATVNYIDFRQDYLNSGFSKTYYLTFTLTNPFDTNHYIKLDFPISLHATPAFSASWNRDAIAYTHTSDTYLPAIMTRSTLPEEASLNTYFIKLLDSSNQPTTLNVNTPYLLKIVSSTAYTATTEGPMDIVGVYVTSGNQENNIVLDSNPTFAPLYFMTHTVGTLTGLNIVNPTITAGSSVTSDVVFTTNQAIASNAKVILSFSSTKFQFLSSSCTIGQSIGVSNCYLENAQKIIFQVAGGLTAGSQTFSVVVQAPLESTVNTAMIIYTIQDFYSDILETATIAPAYVADTLPATTITNYVSTFAWGFSTDATVATGSPTPPCMGVYYYTGDQIVYNTFTFSFTIGTTMPSSTYKFRLNLQGAQAVLENSIKENFPASTGKVVCRAGTQEVTCTPLSTPTAGSIYTISMRVALTAATLSANFGNIEFYAFDTETNDYTTNSIIPSNRATLTLTPQLNLNNKQVAGQAPITSWSPSVAPDSTKPGLKMGDVSYFEFNVNTELADFGSFTPLAATESAGGLEVFTNARVISITDAASCGSASPTASSYASICSSQMRTFQSLDTVRFRIGFYNTIDFPNQLRNQVAFNGNVAFTFTYAANNYPSVTSAGYFADDDVVDLFFAAINKQLDQPTLDFITAPNSCYLMNGYTVSSPDSALTNMNVYISNFWTGTGTNFMTGNEFPAFIQVKGNLNDADFGTDTNKLSLFFDNLTPFPDEDYDTTNKVACSGTQGIECYYYPGGSSITGNYYFYNRIDIVTTMSNRTLQIVIPMATTAAQGQINAVLGTADPYTDLPAKINLGSLRTGKPFAFNFGVTTTQLYTVEDADIYNENYYLETTNKKTGEQSTATIYANHIDTANAFNPNTADQRSALYTWTTKYNFYNRTTAASPPIATFMGSDKCLFFTYYYPADTAYTRRYGVTCPVNSNIDMPLTPEPNINIPNFLFPTVEGVNMPESFGALCNNDGSLTEFKRDIRTNALMPNYVSNVSFDEVLYQSEKASIGTVRFTTTNILPQNSTLKFNSSTAPLQFSVKEGFYCALFQDTVPNLQNTLLPNNCYQSCDGYNIILKINNSVPWTGTNYILKLYEINITDFIEISFQSYNFSTYTDRNLMIDDTVPSFSTVSAVSFLTQTRRSDLAIESYSVLSDNAETKTQILLTVSTSAIKPLTRFDELRIQFWTVSEALDETFAYDVMDFGSESTNILKSCKVNIPYIACTPYYDMLVPQKFTVRLRSFRNPSTQSELKYYMWDLEGNFVLNSTSLLPIKYPTTLTIAPGFTDLYLEKRFNYITMYPSFIFSITLPFGLNITSAIVVRFPSLYSATDVTDPMLCIIGALETNCFLSGPQEVTITDLPLDQPANQLFRLSILGLRQPRISQPYNISIQITKKNEYGTVLAYQEIPDIIPAGTSALKPIRATRVSVSSTPYALESPDLTISFIVDPGVAGALNGNRSIVLDFPNYYGLIYHNTSINYTLMQGTTVLDTETVSMQYFRIEVPVPASASFSQDVEYTIVLQGIPNPFFETFSHSLLLISVTAANRFDVEFQGQRYDLNIEAPAEYAFNPTKYNLKFFQASGTTLTEMTYLSPFKVFAGLPSQEFEIQVADTVRFDRMILMNPGNLNGIRFNSTPDSLNISCGLVGYKFSLTFPLDTAPGFYGLKFAKVEVDPSTDLNTELYSAIPPLLIQLISQQNPINLPVFVDNTLNLPSGGYSFPINFDLSGIKPPNSLTIVAYIPPTSDIDIQFTGYTEITLTSDAPVGSFTLVHVGGGTPGSSQTTISFYLDGPDKGLYTVDPTPIIVKLISLGDTAPDLTAAVPIDSITTNGFDITVNSDQISQVFYQIIGYYGTPNTYWEFAPVQTEEIDLDYVKEMVEAGDTYVNDAFERKDEFYGVYNYQTANTVSTFSITGLRSRVPYTLRVWAVNLKGEPSTMYTTTVTTDDNRGRKTSISFTFSDVLENRQINKIACWLSVRYRLPFDNVKDFQGFSCNDNRTRTPYLLDNILSSQYRIYQQRDLGSGQHTYTFYLYPLSFLDDDDSHTNLLTDVSSSFVNDNLSSFVTDWVFTPATLISVQTPEIMTTSNIGFTSTEFFMSSTNSSIKISNLALNQRGYIWVYALRKSPQTSNFSDVFVPTKGEFKHYLNRRLLDQNYVAMRYYDETAPVDIVFDGLNPSDDYIVHWFAQNDDSGNENVTTYIRSYYIQTKSSSIMALSSLLMGLVMVMTLLL